MANKSTTNSQPPAKEEKGGSPLVPTLPKDEHEEELIDEALTETFPASDPIAIPTPKDKQPPAKNDRRASERVQR
jgi:hypothetical protein